MEFSAVCVPKASSSILHSPFSDQTHLQFYGSSSLSPFKLSFNIPSLASKPTKLPLRALCDSACEAPLELTAEQALMKEIADLKLQMKQKKKELKSRMKDDKEKLKMQSKDAKKMKKQKDVGEGKTKMVKSSSSSSESSDEECESVSMGMLRQGQSMLEVTRVNIEGGLGIAASASDAIEVCNGFSSDVLSLANDAMESCTEDSSSVFSLGRDNPEVHSSVPSLCGFLSTPHNVTSGSEKVHTPHNVTSGLEEVHKHPSTCGMISSFQSVPGLGFTSNAFPSPHVSNRIEVCAGGKCKKAGSEQLLLAMKGQIPGLSNVEAVPCKCMGKCSMTINVRVHKEDTNPQHHSHVGVEDASIILGHHFGLGCPSTRLPSLAAPKDGKRVPSPLVMV